MCLKIISACPYTIQTVPLNIVKILNNCKYHMKNYADQRRCNQILLLSSRKSLSETNIRDYLLCKKSITSDTTQYYQHHYCQMQTMLVNKMNMMALTLKWYCNQKTLFMFSLDFKTLCPIVLTVTLNVYFVSLFNLLFVKFWRFPVNSRYCILVSSLLTSLLRKVQNTFFFPR